MKYVVLICSFVISSNILLAASGLSGGAGAASGLSGGAGAASGGGSTGEFSYDRDSELARQLQDAEDALGGAVYIPTSDVGTFVSQTAEGLQAEFAGRFELLQKQVQDLQEQVSAQKRELQDVKKLLFALMRNPSSSKQ